MAARLAARFGLCYVTFVDQRRCSTPAAKCEKARPDSRGDAYLIQLALTIVAVRLSETFSGRDRRIGTTTYARSPFSQAHHLPCTTCVEEFLSFWLAHGPGQTRTSPSRQHALLRGSDSVTSSFWISVVVRHRLQSARRPGRTAETTLT